MIPIKIQCGCGQRYAFDVKPVAGRMPHSVACPVCGLDGTAAANLVISQSLREPIPAALVPALGPADSTKLAIGAGGSKGTRPGVRASAALQPDRSKAEAEARSKVCWGDSPEEVVKFAMTQGIARDEAVELVHSLLRERFGMLRGIGTRKIITGIPLICVPLVALGVFLKIGFLPIKIFAITVMAGLYGVYLTYRGCFMVFLPKFEGGDIADK
jgi:hypothetical protein